MEWQRKKWEAHSSHFFAQWIALSSWVGFGFMSQLCFHDSALSSWFSNSSSEVMMLSHIMNLCLFLHNFFFLLFRPSPVLSSPTHSSFFVHHLGSRAKRINENKGRGGITHCLNSIELCCVVLWWDIGHETWKQEFTPQQREEDMYINQNPYYGLGMKERERELKEQWNRQKKQSPSPNPNPNLNLNLKQKT